MDNSIAYQGKHIQVVNQDNWEYVERIGTHRAVGIIAITDDNEILLVEQFRIPLQNRTIELPAGIVDKDSDKTLLETAQCELLEEAGYEADKWWNLLDCPLSPGLSSEVLTLFVATQLNRVNEGGGLKSEGEHIKVHKVKLSVLQEWINDKVDRKYLVDVKVNAAPFLLSKLS